MDDLLGQIQRLQFTDVSTAENLLLTFMRETLGLDATAVELRPLAVSLNSFNGFMTLADGRRLFFKTHTESDNLIREYYNAGALAEAGYPVLQPLYSSTDAGRQLLVYEVITDPSVFDVAWEIEQGQEALLPVLTQAQQQADALLYTIYQATLCEQTGEDAAHAPVHQLFYHRLAGGRLARFYGGEGQAAATISLPTGRYPMQTVRRARWEVNSQRYQVSLDDLIDQAMRLLLPAQAGAAVVGHGDAHNGNVFLRQDGDTAALLYFDPAFAGRHSPLLDLVKPLFHNVFAMWMYFPHIKREQTRVTLDIDGDNWRVEHDYALPSVRHMFLQSKVERVLVPTLHLLARRGLLRADWRAYLKAALFCCPLLTMNLADGDKFSPDISLLGLAMSVEMGAESEGERSMIDRVLDEVEAAL